MLLLMSTKTPDAEAELPASIVLTAEGVGYEFIRELGVGPHGEQWVLARPRLPEGPGTPVVIRSLGPTAEAGARARLEEEARVASLLEHPVITRVHGLHTVAGTLYAVQEYVESRSLDELYTDALLCGTFCSERFVLHVAAELASALHAAHTRTDASGQLLGIVHRELHPERIHFSTQGQVKLEGFGLATSPPRITGPVVYAAPEQLLQRPVEARSELFSLGLIMLELLTGQHLYQPMEDVDLRGMALNMATLSADTLKMMGAAVDELGRLHERARRHEGLAQVTQQATSFGFEDVERLTQKVPGPTRFILHRLLRPEPQERYGSAAELEWALRERLHTLGAYGAREAAEEAFLLQVQASGLPSWDDMEPGQELGQELALFPPGEPEEVTTQPC